MLDQTAQSSENRVEDAAERPEIPARRGSRDERREATLRAIAADGVGHCAYCGRRLPPLLPRGGRPTPYCPADPDRYGRWGAKVISCAMLDENREIWVQVYGPDQSMTHVDVQVVDDRAATLLAALEPVHEELTALRTRIADETTAALAARNAADAACDAARQQADHASAERDRALAEAEAAQRQAAQDRADLLAAQENASAAGKERDAAVADRHTAQRARVAAETDRQRALEQVTAAQDRVTELQTVLAGERAGAVEQLDRLRQEADQERRKLRDELAVDYEQRLRARTGEFDAQLRAAQTGADQRITELTGRLAEATQRYADALGPLHEQLAGLQAQLADRSTALAELGRRHDALLMAARQLLRDPGDEDLRHRLAAELGPAPEGKENGAPTP
ncbi:coiled-coil domain-containing protein [Amycolatopsis samaneae]|uniref:Chromosome segregation ATPase n=1 Tax=Amycolatopsis samaneae TaxID=664691 RepID=A0ABW5GQ12_9PSEU